MSAPSLLLLLFGSCCFTGWTPSLVGLVMAHPEPEFIGSVQNLTVPAGRDVKFACHVRHLGSYKVAWIHFERSAILTVHTHVITRNPRVGVSHENHRTWYLHLSDVQEADRGRYLCQINTALSKTQSAYLNVVVPPTIDDGLSNSDVIVREGSDHSLVCHARGSPPPAVKWRREDGRKISSNKTFSALEVEGSTLELSKISRLDMGVYLCIASNGVPPAVSKRIHVNVDFPPMVWVPQQLVGAALASTVTIECLLEAHPAALHYWTRPDGQVLHDPSKYRMESLHGVASANADANDIVGRPSFTSSTGSWNEPGQETLGPLAPSSYKTHLKLSIRHLTIKDFGSYRCVAKNPRGETDGTIKIYQTDRTGQMIKAAAAGGSGGGSAATDASTTSAELLEYSQTKMRSANVAAAETDQLDDDEDDIHVESKRSHSQPSTTAGHSAVVPGGRTTSSASQRIDRPSKTALLLLLAIVFCPATATGHS